MKNFITSLFLAVIALTSLAQEKIHQINEISVINYGDGRLLFRQLDEVPLQGEYRLINGYRSEYLLAEFKEGMYNGNYQHFKSNKIKEEGTYIDGHKDGIFKEYYYCCPVKIYSNALLDCYYEFYSVLCNRGLGIFTADTNNFVYTFFYKKVRT